MNTEKTTKNKQAHQDLEAIYDWMRLKVQINRHLKAWIKDHYSQIRPRFPWASDEMFASVVDEMEQEGLLIKEVGKNGGIVLIRKEAK